MVIHKCDRCGTETDNPHTIFYSVDQIGAANKSAELCDKCHASLLNWLSGTDDICYNSDESHWQTVTDKTERNGG